MTAWQGRRVVWVLGMVALLIGGMGAPAALADDPFMTLTGQFQSQEGAEIVAYDKFTNRLFSTTGDGIETINFGWGYSHQLTKIGGTQIENLTDIANGEVSSVATDPLGRGFGVALVIPEDNIGTVGKAVFFDTTDGSRIKVLDLTDGQNGGYHPDMVTFSKDGTKVLIANEGEQDAPNDAPGSIGVVDVSGVTDSPARNAQIGALGSGQVTIAGFAGVPGVNGVRLFPDGAGGTIAPELDLEPEYIAEAGGKAYVALQEANAIGVFDLNTLQWDEVFSLGTITQTVDASNEDGILIDDEVAGLLQPDGIAAYEKGGQTFLFTANEGDSRDEDKDFEDVVAEGNIDDNTDADGNDALGDLNALYQSKIGKNADSDDALGNLEISEIDGDTDGDGDIDVPTMFGTRSFSAIEAASKTIIEDSESDFEQITAAEIPTLFNSEENDPGEFDSRSDNKGPEPEGITIGQLGDAIYAFIGLERTGGVMVYDITDPANFLFIDYIRTDSQAPEGLAFISPLDSPNGRAFLVVANEDSNTIDVFTIPEPASVALLGLGAIGLVRRRR